MTHRWWAAAFWTSVSRRVEHLAELGGADRGSHGAEFGRFAAGVLESRPGVGIDQLALRDVGVAACDQLSRMLSFQESSGNSAGPEVDPFASIFGDLGMDDDVSDLEAPAGLEDAIDLVEHGIFIGDQVDYAI